MIVIVLLGAQQCPLRRMLEIKVFILKRIKQNMGEVKTMRRDVSGTVYLSCPVGYPLLLVITLQSNFLSYCAATFSIKLFATESVIIQIVAAKRGLFSFVLFYFKKYCV